MQTIAAPATPMLAERPGLEERLLRLGAVGSLRLLPTTARMTDDTWWKKPETELRRPEPLELEPRCANKLIKSPDRRAKAPSCTMSNGAGTNRLRKPLPVDRPEVRRS
jgi:hypothetical protein